MNLNRIRQNIGKFILNNFVFEKSMNNYSLIIKVHQFDAPYFGIAIKTISVGKMLPPCDLR